MSAAAPALRCYGWRRQLAKTGTCSAAMSRLRCWRWHGSVSPRRGSATLTWFRPTRTYDFAEDAIDLVVSRFGVMFFADPTAAFANLRRSLRPGGRLAFVCWAPMADNPFFLLPMEVATRHLGPAEPPPPRAPGPLAFSEPDYVSDILMSAGWSDVRIETRQPPLLGCATAQEQAAFSLELGPV